MVKQFPNDVFEHPMVITVKNASIIYILIGILRSMHHDFQPVKVRSLKVAIYTR